MRQIFNFSKDVIILYLVKNNFLYSKSRRPSFSILEKSLANSEPDARDAGACWTKVDCGIFSAICLCWAEHNCDNKNLLATASMPVGLIRVWAASTNTSWVLNPLMGNPRAVRVKEVSEEYLLLRLFQKQSAHTLETDCRCALVHAAPQTASLYRHVSVQLFQSCDPQTVVLIASCIFWWMRLFSLLSSGRSAPSGVLGPVMTRT